MPKNTAGSKKFFQWIKGFFSTQIGSLAARTSSPPLTGIHLIQDDYTPVKLVDHPGYGAHEEIEPMK